MVRKHAGKKQPQKTDELLIETCDLSVVNADQGNLEIIRSYLDSQPNEVMSITGCSRGVDDEKIIYRPYESFQKRKEWTTGRFVGEVSVPSFSKNDKVQTIRLQIKPRFGFPFVVHMLENIFNFQMPKSERKYQDKWNSWNDFLRPFIRLLWIAKFSQADKYGLPRKTVKRTQQSVKIRGHLNVRRSILPLYTKGEVLSEYFEKDFDDTIGRIVYKAYDILCKDGLAESTVPTQVHDSINNLYSRYHGQQFVITKAEYEKIQYKNIYESWKPLVDFSWQIIQQKGIDTQNTSDGKGYALLLDMAEIWEAYIAKIVKNSFKHITSQNSAINLLDREDEMGFQKIIPDYLSLSYEVGGSGQKAFAGAVGDAKYIDLENVTKLSAERAAGIYYKTVMYMYRFNSTLGFLFYPDMHSATEKEHFEEFRIVGTGGVIVKAGFPIPTINSDGLYDESEMKRIEESFSKKVFERALKQ